MQLLLKRNSPGEMATSSSGFPMPVRYSMNDHSAAGSHKPMDFGITYFSIFIASAETFSYSIVQARHENWPDEHPYKRRTNIRDGIERTLRARFGAFIVYFCLVCYAFLFSAKRSPFLLRVFSAKHSSLLIHVFLFCYTRFLSATRLCFLLHAFPLCYMSLHSVTDLFFLLQVFLFC